MKTFIKRTLAALLVAVMVLSVAPLGGFADLLDFSVEANAASYPAIPALKITRVRQGPRMCTWASLSTVQGYCSGTYEGYNYRQPGVDFYYGTGKSADLSSKNDPMSKLITKKCTDADWGSSMKGKLPHEMVYVTSGIGNNAETYKKIYDQLKKGKPVILYLGNGVHTSVVIAYNGSSSKLETSGFTVMDVAKDTWENSSSYYNKYANNPQSITKYDSCYVTLSSWLSYDGGRTIKAIYYPKNDIDSSGSSSGSSPESTFKFNSVTAESITKTDAQIKATFDLQQIDGSGFYIGTSKTNLKKVSKSLSGEVDGAGKFNNIYYKMSKWYGTLSSNTTYYYKLYVIKNGKECATEIKSFKTLPQTYTVKYDANGGSGAPSSQTKTQGTDLTLSSTKPTRSGYIFKGWATSKNGNVAYNPGGKYSKDASVTLYAVWGANLVAPDLNNYSLSLNYKDIYKLEAKTNKPVAWSSSDSSVAVVDGEGNVYAADEGTAQIYCTVYDSAGNSVSSVCDVTVSYAWWQWIIVIVLFGWIWY